MKSRGSYPASIGKTLGFSASIISGKMSRFVDVIVTGRFCENSSFHTLQQTKHEIPTITLSIT